MITVPYNKLYIKSILFFLQSRTNLEQETVTSRFDIRLLVRFSWTLEKQCLMRLIHSQSISILRRPQSKLPPAELITKWKLFIRPYLEHSDVLYDQFSNFSIHQNIESIQWNAALALTRAMKKDSTEMLHHSLALESPRQRRWHKKLNCFQRFKKTRHLFTFIT